MPRSGVDARRRLQGAALQLWSEHGYGSITAAEIAATAGVTERTFFRHFPDKREVLFDGAAAMRQMLVDALANAPAAMTPLTALRTAFCAVESLLEENRAYSSTRHKIIAETPALQEREMAKAAALVHSLALGLQRRDLEPRLAKLAAETGIAAFNYAVASWNDRPERRFPAHLETAFDELVALARP